MNSYINDYMSVTLADAAPHFFTSSIDAGVNALYDERTWLESFHFKKKFIMRNCQTYLSFIKYFDEAKTEYFNELGLDVELNNRDFNFVISEMNCQCCHEAEYRDVIEVLIKTTDIGNSCINLEYVIIESYTREIIFLGSVDFILMDKRGYNYISIPPRIRQGLYEF